MRCLRAAPLLGFIQAVMRWTSSSRRSRLQAAVGPRAVVALVAETAMLSHAVHELLRSHLFCCALVLPLPCCLGPSLLRALPSLRLQQGRELPSEPPALLRTRAIMTRSSLLSCRHTTSNIGARVRRNQAKESCQFPYSFHWLCCGHCCFHIDQDKSCQLLGVLFNPREFKDAVPLGY